jgi:hypothetical protein
VVRSANPKAWESQADLTLSFFYPDSPDAQPPSQYHDGGWDNLTSRRFSLFGTKLEI